MGRHHHVHSFGDWHQSHHSRHHDHHHHHDHVFGGRGDDVLVGTAKSSVIIGGRGDDIAVFAPAAHSGADVCGKGDFYDGGGGHDVLRLILTADELSDAGVQADIAAFQAFLADNPHRCGGHGEIFKFTSFDLAVRNFEELDIQGDGTPPAGSNTPPVGVDDLVQATEDTPVVISVLENDSDADGDPLSAVVVDKPTHGNLAVNADGTFTYTPDADYNSNYGPDGFTYRASDGSDDSELTNVAIDVAPVNDAPRMVREPDWGPVDVPDSPNIKIDILSYYAPGPEDEAGQSLELQFSDFMWTTYGLAGKTAEDTISYTAFSVPPDGFETLGYAILDDAGGSTSASLDVYVI